jgi:dTDP-glucose 4,6-dehydratase
MTEVSPLPSFRPLASPVLVTGAGGFIGSHLVEALVDANYQVRAFTHYNSAGSWGWLETSPVRKDIEVVPGDIRDFDSVQRAVQDCRTVFHLAALIGIPYSYLSPLAYVKTNMEGTYNVLEACRNEGVERVVVTSTSETYGTAQRIPIDEDHPAVGQSPYSASKIGADQLALSYHLSFGLPVAIARPFNTYGPRQSARAFIPTVMAQILAGGTKVHLGNLDPTRDLTFVTDTVAAFLALAACEEAVGGATNIGMGREISMGDLARKIAHISGTAVEIESDVKRLRPDNSEVQRLCCDNSRLLSLTKWRPQYNLETGLAETFEWVRANLDRFKPSVYNL